MSSTTTESGLPGTMTAVRGPRLTVAGIGTRVSRDDAIGLVLIDDLPTMPGLEVSSWEDADALTLAHQLLQLTAPVLLVDCADLRLAPGNWRSLELDRVRLRSSTGSVSTHGLGLAEAVSIAGELGFDQKIHLFAVQPFDIRPGLGLSAGLREKVPGLREALQARVFELLAVPAREAVSG